VNGTVVSWSPEGFLLLMLHTDQGVTTRCRLSWLTNIALVYEPKCGGRGVSANENSCAHGAQINVGDLASYSTYDTDRLVCSDKPSVVPLTFEHSSPITMMVFSVLGGCQQYEIYVYYVNLDTRNGISLRFLIFLISFPASL
jgi:hypothetical protein